jgi:hypothetical protein
LLGSILAATAFSAREFTNFARSFRPRLATGVPIPKSINVGKGSSASGTVLLKTQSSKYKPLTTSTKTDSIPGSQTPGGNSGKGSHIIDFPEALKQGTARTIHKADSPVWQGLKPYKGNTRTNGLSGRKNAYINGIILIMI